MSDDSEKTMAAILTAALSDAPPFRVGMEQVHETLERNDEVHDAALDLVRYMRDDLGLSYVRCITVMNLVAAAADNPRAYMGMWVHAVTKSAFFGDSPPPDDTPESAARKAAGAARVVDLAKEYFGGSDQK